jgi:hypothetical protein
MSESATRITVSAKGLINYQDRRRFFDYRDI